MLRNHFTPHYVIAETRKFWGRQMKLYGEHMELLTQLTNQMADFVVGNINHQLVRNGEAMITIFEEVRGLNRDFVEMMEKTYAGAYFERIGKDAAGRDIYRAEFPGKLEKFPTATAKLGLMRQAVSQAIAK